MEELLTGSAEISQKPLKRSARGALLDRVTNLVSAGRRPLTSEQAARDDRSNDPLTSLPNRAFFTEALERCALRTEREPEYRFAVLFLDLDNFKRINDTLGHSVGDELLVAVARRLEVCVRRGDVVARMGGDEFTIVLEDIENVRNATRIAEEMLSMVSKPFKLTGVEISTAASIGISFSSREESNPSKLLRDADMALYRAKDAGRGRFEVFDAVMHAETIARLKLEAELRVAVEQNQFSLFYQPIIELRRKEIVGFESLLRWHHPERGILSADEFIEVAAETGLILPLGRWVLRQACRQIAMWHAHFDRETPLTMSVNVCTKELVTPGLLERLHNLLHETALPPGSLRLEITEGFVIDHSDLARTLLNQISEANVQVQMDDFGKGYSSLTLLHAYPIKAIKIDGDFVAGIAGSQANSELIKAIVSIASALNIDVVAEGIETLDQLNAMQALGCCHFGQGYFYSRPVPAEVATAILMAGGTIEALNPKVYGPVANLGRHLS